jgi:ATP-dependent helicase HrpA
VPVDFPELYTFERMKELPRYCRALALRAERGSLNLVTARKKLQDVLSYSQKLQQMVNGCVQPGLFDLAVFKKLSSPKDSTDPKDSTFPQIGIQEITGFKEDSAVDYPYEKKTLVEEFFWMIEEYKVSLFAQELKTPYPVSPKKLNQLIEKIEER